MRLAAIVVCAAACRIGFDPVDQRAQLADAGAGSNDAAARRAVTCIPDQLCLVSCGPDDPCDVDCAGASHCVVSCEGACSIAACGPTCVVECGDGREPIRTGAEATCL